MMVILTSFSHLRVVVCCFSQSEACKQTHNKQKNKEKIKINIKKKTRKEEKIPKERKKNVSEDRILPLFTILIPE